MNRITVNNNQRTANQAGVTLLLSIVILSGLTLITVTVATFAIQELRASRAIIATEPAIAAAESAGEKGLWSVKRGNALASCSNPDTQALTNNTLLNTCKSYDEAVFDVNGGIPFTFYLYNPDDINGDIDLNNCPLDASSSTQCFSELNIEHVSGNSPLDIAVTRVDGSTTGISPASPTALISGEDVDINITGVTSNTEGRIKVTLSASSDVTVKVNTDRGMPTFPTIQAYACSSRGAVSTCNPSSDQELFNRRINITVPELTGSFGSATPTPPPSPTPIPPPPPPPAISATFVAVDSTSLGNWKGIYGGAGKGIANHITQYPSYASVSTTNALTFTWADPSTDARALRKNTGNQRIASTWYNTGTFSFNVNITDGNTHQVALYMVDFDNASRSQTIEIVDATNGTVLDTKSVSSLTGGLYYIWNVRGNVRINITQTGATNAVISGIFFD